MAKKATLFWQGWLVDNPLTEDPNDFTLKVEVDMRRLTVNNPSALSFRVPKLAPGDYWLELTTRFSKGQLVKEARTVRFEKVLNV